MFRRSSIIFAASLALLSTLDSATCFAAPAPAQPREDLERPRFLKKEIRRFVFTNTTSSRDGPSGESSTSDLEALHETLTSSLPQDLEAGATPTSATPTITTTLSVTSSDIGQSSSPDLSLTSAGDDNRDREALILRPSVTATPVSSEPPPSSSPNDGNSNGVTGLSQSSSSSSVSNSDQLSGNEALPQATDSSTVELLDNSVTSSQLGSIAQPESSASPSSAALPKSLKNPSDIFAIAHTTSISITSESSISGAGGQGLSTLGPQTSSSTEQPSSSLSKGGEASPTTTLITGLSSPVATAGESTTFKSSGNEAVPQATDPSTVEQLDNSVTSSQLSSIAQPKSSASPSSAALSNSLENLSDVFVIAHTTSSSIVSESSVSSAEGQGLSTSGPQTSSSTKQPSSSLSKGGEAPPTTTLITGLSSPIATAGETTTSESKTETLISAVTTDTGSLESPPTTTLITGLSSPVATTEETTTSESESETVVSAVTTDTGSLESPPVTATDTGSSAVALPTETNTKSNTNDEAVTTTTGESPAVTSVENSLTPVTVETIKTSPTDLSDTSSGEETPFGIPTSNTGTVISNTDVNSVVPTALSSGAGAVNTPTAQPASSPVAPQSVTVSATGSDVGSETGSVTAHSGATQPTQTPGLGPGQTSESGGFLGSSASVVLQTTPVHAASQVGESTSPTTSTDSTVVPDSAQITTAAKATTVPLENPSASVPSTGGDQNSSPSLNPGTTQAPTVLNPSFAAAASKLNTIPALTENPSAGGSGVTSLEPNSALTAAASALHALPPSVKNSEYQVSLPVSTQSSSPVVSGFSSSSGEGPQNTAGATGSSAGTASHVGGLPSSVVTGSSVEASESPVSVGATNSAVGATGSSTGGTASSVGGTGSYTSAEPTPGQTSGASGSTHQNPQSIAPSVTSESGIAGYSTQNSAASPAPTATPVVPPHQQYIGKGPYTQLPVGSDSSTTQVVPTIILHGPSSTPSVTQGSFGPFSLPSNVPQILYPNGGPGPQPPSTSLIHLAFKYALNYLFVYNHTAAQQQLFHYIPLGILYGLEIEITQVTMQSLRAWDTYEDVGYVTTLALAWIPQGLVGNLGLLVSNSSSRFYSNPDNSTAFLLSMTNNTIPIFGGNATDGASTPFGNTPSDTNSPKTAGAPIGGDTGISQHVRASSVGIGVGVSCVAAAYGAAMFFVARRYKKRRQSHLRSPSMFSSPVMSHAGPDAGAGAALMSGAMGARSASPYYDNDGRAGSRGSGRSGSSRHQISAPVMAENSLGWN